MRKFLSLLTALVLCTAMWGDSYATFYRIKGALYQGLNNEYKTDKKLFVPNGGSVTFTTTDTTNADWYSNDKLKKEGVPSFTTSALSDASYYNYQIKNYSGYEAQNPKIDYIYGTTSSRITAGSGTMYMMSMASSYCVCTEATNTENIGKYYVDNRTATCYSSNTSYGTYMKYGTDFTHSTRGAVEAYEMILDNPGEMYIDYVLLPIFGYPKKDATTIANMIPEGKKITLELYPCTLTLDEHGVYNHKKGDAPLATITATAEDFTQGDKSYNGLVKFTLENPLLITTDFVARLTWEDGCQFGLITDSKNLQNYTTWYIFNGNKYYMWTGGGANSSISYHAMFPTLEKKDDVETLTFTHEGGNQEIAIKSNIDPADEDFTIDFGGADWIRLDSLRYTTEDKYNAKEAVYIVFQADVNEGVARETTITLKHHGKTLEYMVKQDKVPGSKYIDIVDSLSVISIPTLGGESKPFLIATNTNVEEWQVNLPDGITYSVTPVLDDTMALVLKHDTYVKEILKDTMVIAVGGETLCKIPYKQARIIIPYLDEPIEEFWAEYEANSKFYYTSDGKNYSLYFFYTPLQRADVEVSAPEWCEVNLRDSSRNELSALALTMIAPQETQTERTGELKIIYKGDELLTYNLHQLGFHGYVKDLYSSQAEGGTVSGNGGQVKFVRYTNTEWVYKTNIDIAYWQIDAPEWIQPTLTAKAADTIALTMFVDVKDFSIEGRTGEVKLTIADTITKTLTITQTAAEKSMSYYNMDGALYYGTGITGGGYSTQYMFVPYADSVPFVSQVGPGTWYLGKNHEVDTTTIGSDIYWMHAPSNVNKYVLYVPYFQSDVKELYSEWQWGGVIKYRANARLHIGTGKKAYLCAPQYHPDSLASGGKTADMYTRSGTLSGQSMRYCYGSKLGDEEQGYYNYIGSYIHTNGVVWADSIFVPIYNYSILNEGADQDKKVIFGDNGKVTLSIYSATKNADGTPNIDREHPIYQATADSTNFIWNTSNNYKGSLIFVKKAQSAIGIDYIVPFISDGGDFYAELSGFNESGVDFGLYSDGYPVAGQENGMGWFYKDGAYKKLWNHSIYMTFNGFFPFLKTMYGATQVNIDATGEKVSVIYPELEPEKQEQSDLLLRSNRDYGEWEFDDSYEWLEIYMDTTDVWNSNNCTDITFIAEPNPGEERTDTLIFVNHGIELRVPVIQEGTATGFINLYEKKNEVKVEKFIKNNNIYIRRDKELFTLEGQKLE